jgi:hypothetical protein
MGDARVSSEMRRRFFIGEGIVSGYQGLVTQRGWVVMSMVFTRVEGLELGLRRITTVIR